MADESTTAPVAPNGTAAPAAPAAPARLDMTSDQLAARLDETRSSARTSVLKEFGFESVADGKKALAALKSFQESQMSEQEKLAAKLKDTETLAARGSTYEKLFKGLVDEQFASLPEAARKAIEEQAGESVEERYKLMSFMRKVGASPTAANGESAGPNVVKPANAAATAPAPKGSPARTKFDEWSDLQKSKPAMAGAFYQVHRVEIERTRPTS